MKYAVVVYKKPVMIVMKYAIVVYKKAVNLNLRKVNVAIDIALVMVVTTVKKVIIYVVNIVVKQNLQSWTKQKWLKMEENLLE